MKLAQRLSPSSRTGVCLASALALSACVLVPGGAAARPYAIRLDEVETEEDLYEIYYEGNLEEDELETLLSLLRDPVDVNQADREALYDLPGLTWEMVDAILAQRDAKGAFRSLDDMALVPGLPQEALEEFSAFAVTLKPREVGDYLRSSWNFKLSWDPRSADETGDSDVAGASREAAPPTLYLGGDAEVMRWLHLGFVVTEGLETYPLDYTEKLPVFRTEAGKEGQIKGYRTGYLVDAPATHWDLAKVYAHTPRTRQSTWSAIVGSYRIGFGMGLVFDTTSREFPNGWKADREIDRSDQLTKSSAARYRDKPGLFGAAASLHRFDVGPFWLSGHAFASRAFRNAYLTLQNDVQRSDFSSESAFSEAQSLYICERDPQSRECTYRVDPATGARIYKQSQITLLDAFAENTGGGNINFHFDERTQIGATLYVSSIDMLLDSEQGLRFSPGAKYPNGVKEFGAAGLHGFLGLGDFALRAEFASTFEGGKAAWVRGFFDRGEVEAELGGRYYDENYDNPWTSPFAEPDLFEGHRARDEYGVNYRISLRPAQNLTVRMKGDLWQRRKTQCILISEDEGEEADPIDYAACQEMAETLAAAGQNADDVLQEDPVNSMTNELSVAYRPLPWLRLTLKPSATDHDLSQGGRSQSYEEGTGSKYSLYGRVDVEPGRWLRVSAAYRHAWVDDEGPRKIFLPSLYEEFKDVDRDGRTCSTELVDEGNTECLKDDCPKYAPPSTCRSLYADSFRQDRYWYLEARGAWRSTSGSLRFKLSEEALGYPSVVGSTGSYWQFTVKLAQRKAFEIFTAQLRYDLLKFVDDRVKWYQEDLRPDHPGELLLSRYTHQLTASASLSF